MTRVMPLLPDPSTGLTTTGKRNRAALAATSPGSFDAAHPYPAMPQAATTWWKAALSRPARAASGYTYGMP